MTKKKDLNNLSISPVSWFVRQSRVLGELLIVFSLIMRRLIWKGTNLTRLFVSKERCAYDHGKIRSLNKCGGKNAEEPATKLDSLAFSAAKQRQFELNKSQGENEPYHTI